jgi:chromatin remodeling complex protein RSC6
MSKVSTSSPASSKTKTTTPKRAGGGGGKTTAAAAVATTTETTVVDTTETTVVDTTETTAVVETGPTVIERLDDLVKSRQALIETLKREVVGLRKLIKDHQNELRLASKSRKKKVVNPDAKPRKPSGFAEPVVVSDHMYTFLAQFGVKKGTPIARTEITKHIIEYIKQHNLQNPERRREIVPDSVLSKLFGPALEHRDPNDTTTPKVYSYLKLQKYLSSHFPKRGVASTTTTSTSA